MSLYEKLGGADAVSAALGAELTIRLDIEAFYPDGIPEDVIRIVSESARTLSFEEGFGFEEE